MAWGFLRESRERAEKDGINADHNLCRTGLDEYLSVIFPNTTDWIHDKTTGHIYNGKKLNTRPDYRSESMKLVVEFDGIPHYQSPLTIRKDERNTRIYEDLGYSVVRIPWFIQLTNSAVEKLFGVVVEEPLFDENIPSMGTNPKSKEFITPACFCMAGVQRMAREFRDFPEQYEVNIRVLKAMNDELLSGAKLLEDLYKQ